MFLSNKHKLYKWHKFCENTKQYVFPPNVTGKGRGGVSWNIKELTMATLKDVYQEGGRPPTPPHPPFGGTLQSCTIIVTWFLIIARIPYPLQTWKNNMAVAGKASINASKQDFTKVVFKPDLAKFKMTHLDRDTVALMTRRAYDIAGCTKGVAVYLNGKKLPVSISFYMYYRKSGNFRC